MVAKKVKTTKKTSPARKTATKKKQTTTSDEGSALPDFSLNAHDGSTVTKKDILGQTTVIFFYPKDDTPGCTKESCEFRDYRKEFSNAGARVFGVSPDSLASHQKFSGKFDLNFPLLSDTEKSLAKKLKVWVKKNMYGREYMGIERSTFLVDAKGKIAKAWRKVKVDGHVEEVLKAAKEL